MTRWRWYVAALSILSAVVVAVTKHFGLYDAIRDAFGVAAVGALVWIAQHHPEWLQAFYNAAVSHYEELVAGYITTPRHARHLARLAVEHAADYQWTAVQIGVLLPPTLAASAHDVETTIVSELDRAGRLGEVRTWVRPDVKAPMSFIFPLGLQGAPVKGAPERAQRGGSESDDAILDELFASFAPRRDGDRGRPPRAQRRGL